MLYLYNSLSRKKEKFISLEDKKVKMYVCGITPYDTTHLGHAFTYVWFDVLNRYLRFLGYRVNYTQNVTDIDDDILRKAREEKRDWRELGNYWTKKFLSDMKALNVLKPTNYVKATSSIVKIVEIVKLLKEKGFAYEKDGNVYFDIRKFRNYGKLSRFSTKQMLILSKERGGNPDDPLKKHPLDFVLWQKFKVNEPSWKSPWPASPAPPRGMQRGEGKGRPGWHIECSSMIIQYLGDRIDIHGGGHDLIFPHHESEIAQSESFTGKKLFVKFWLHTAMVLYQGEKMAKSLGNLIMVPDLLKKCSANIIRWVILSHHYREPWQFDESQIKKAQQSLAGITSKAGKIGRLIFKKSMNDDLNVPKILESNPSKEILSLLGFSF